MAGFVENVNKLALNMDKILVSVDELKSMVDHIPQLEEIIIDVIPNIDAIQHINDNATAIEGMKAELDTKLNALSDLSVVTESLPTGSEYTSSYDNLTNTLTLGIAKGEKGDIGLTGPQGIQGVKGDKGESYTPDAIGTLADRSSYDNELKGFSFVDYINGVIYFKIEDTVGVWSTGSPFGRGEKGDTGLKGDKGDKGDTGDTGPQGLQGPIGLTGERGPQGIPGPQGIQGPKGDSGPQGERGLQGVQGPVGPAIVLSLNNDSATIPSDVYGNVITYVGASTTASVFNNGINETAHWTFTCSKMNLECSESITSRTQTVIELIDDVGYVDITASRSGYDSLTKRFTVTKARQGFTGEAGLAGPAGPQGEQGIQGNNGLDGVNGLDGANGLDGYSPIHAIISNEATALPADENGNVLSYETSSTIISVVEGQSILKYGNPDNIGEYTVNITAVGITHGNVVTDGLNAVILPHSNFDNALLTSFVTYSITGKSNSGIAFTFTKDQTITKVKRGQQGYTGLTGAAGADGANGIDGVNGLDGSHAISVILSNEAHCFQAASDGAVSDYSYSGTTIFVYQASQQLTFDGVGNSPGTYNVTTSTSNISLSGSVTNSSGNALIANLTNFLTASNTATATYTISGMDFNGHAFNIIKLQTFTKAKSGADGTNSVYVTLSVPSFSFPLNMETITVTSYAGSGTQIVAIEGLVPMQYVPSRNAATVQNGEYFVTAVGTAITPGAMSIDVINDGVDTCMVADHSGADLTSTLTPSVTYTIVGKTSKGTYFSKDVKQSFSIIPLTLTNSIAVTGVSNADIINTSTLGAYGFYGYSSESATYFDSTGKFSITVYVETGHAFITDHINGTYTGVQLLNNSTLAGRMMRTCYDTVLNHLYVFTWDVFMTHSYVYNTRTVNIPDTTLQFRRFTFTNGVLAETTALSTVVMPNEYKGINDVIVVNSWIAFATTTGFVVKDKNYLDQTFMYGTAYNVRQLIGDTNGIGVSRVFFTNGQLILLLDPYGQGTKNGLVVTVTFNIYNTSACTFTVQDNSPYPTYKRSELFYFKNTYHIFTPFNNSVMHHTSTDLVTWTLNQIAYITTPYTNGDFFAIIISNNKIYLHLNSHQYYYVSSDGFTWAGYDYATAVGIKGTLAAGVITCSSYASITLLKSDPYSYGNYTKFLIKTLLQIGGVDIATKNDINKLSGNSYISTTGSDSGSLDLSGGTYNSLDGWSGYMRQIISLKTETAGTIKYLRINLNYCIMSHYSTQLDLGLTGNMSTSITPAVGDVYVFMSLGAYSGTIGSWKLINVIPGPLSTQNAVTFGKTAVDRLLYKTTYMWQSGNTVTIDAARTSTRVSMSGDVTLNLVDNYVLPNLHGSYAVSPMYVTLDNTNGTTDYNIYYGSGFSTIIQAGGNDIYKARAGTVTVLCINNISPNTYVTNLSQQLSQVKLKDPLYSKITADAYGKLIIDTIAADIVYVNTSAIIYSFGTTKTSGLTKKLVFLNDLSKIFQYPTCTSNIYASSYITPSTNEMFEVIADSNAIFYGTISNVVLTVTSASGVIVPNQEFTYTGMTAAIPNYIVTQRTASAIHTSTATSGSIGSTTLILSSVPAYLKAGMHISGTGIPDGTYIGPTYTSSSTSIPLVNYSGTSVAMTASYSGTYTIGNSGGVGTYVINSALTVSTSVEFVSTHWRLIPTNTSIYSSNFSLMANRCITGGGTITFSSSYYVLWSQRFMIAAHGYSNSTASSGYFEITCPTSGTITGVGGATNKTATINGIPLASWESLYYILPLGASYTTNAANFRVVGYTAAIDIPSNWLKICQFNGDGLYIEFFNNIALRSNTSINTNLFDVLGSDVSGAVALASALSTTTTAILHSGTTGIGYAAGAGGTVTQATSRTTAVTLAKLTGTITLFSTTTTAGSIVSFTVTNTLVAATDSIIVNHISGGTLGAYIINACNIAAGSFTITVYTPAAQAAAAPIIRFTVIKGVSA